MIDEEKLKNTEFRYGKITKRTVIYRGENATLENGTEKARKLKNEKSKRLIKSAILGNADKIKSRHFTKR